MNEEYLEQIFPKYNLGYVVHGDHACLVNGKDVYAATKNGEKTKQLPSLKVKTETTGFRVTMQISPLPSSDFRPPMEEDTIVYVLGRWDLFHAGHFSIQVIFIFLIDITTN
ncbi:hypothetical protein Zmor_016347 [Zophobas morio]|uniref:Uncharacterized protein n=1 Tax=Zophobas morio TaxID=2755281 RepID=A0AA38LYN6_9CUCU|nr:hypothetical protein Zmor_016347 [Zophobas morio]